MQARVVKIGQIQAADQWAKGEPFSMFPEHCSRAGCLRGAVTSLGDKDYCFEHFCSRCYEILERSHRGAEFGLSSTELREERYMLDECARRALEVSFSRLPLNNLDRARLLDILLWAGDLTSAVRHRTTAAPSAAADKPELVRAGASRNWRTGF